MIKLATKIGVIGKRWYNGKTSIILLHNVNILHAIYYIRKITLILEHFID